MKNKSNQTQAFRYVLSAWCLLFFFSIGMFAQQLTVKGNVKDATGEPIIGASVLIKGTTNGTITDFDGNFSLPDVSSGATIEITFVGYLPQTLKASSSPLNVVLQEDAKTLDEVVVVGYGVQKKSVVTASIAKVSADDLSSTSPVRVDNALKGLASGVTVTYDFSYGWQSAWKKRDVLNATEYALMRNEGAVNAGIAPVYNDPYTFGEGTDWQNEVFNDNAPLMNHQVSVSGAGETVSYLFSAGYYTQDGIIGGNYDRSNYNRLTLRSNTLYTLFDESKNRNWLNSMKVTSNLSYARIKSKDIEANSTWGSPLGSALSMSPLLSVYLEGDEAQKQLDYYKDTPSYTPQYGPNGKLLMVPGDAYNEMTNPIANLLLPGRNN